MYGKDLTESAILSNKICKILGKKPPNGFAYELFLDEKGETKRALDLIEGIIDKNKNDIRIDLMKLKLSIATANPIELGHQIDSIISKNIRAYKND